MQHLTVLGKWALLCMSLIYLSITVLRKWASMCAALNCPQKVDIIVRGPYMYYQLLSSESGPQCVRPLNVLRKWASSSKKNFTVLKKWASMCASFLCVIIFELPIPDDTRWPFPLIRACTVYIEFTNLMADSVSSVYLCVCLPGQPNLCVFPWPTSVPFYVRSILHV